MINSFLNNTEYLVYILAGKNKEILIGMADETNGFSISSLKKYSRLVYFEKFMDKKKALERKRALMRSEKRKILSVVTKNNPEWLNLIEILYEIHNYKIKNNIN